MDNEDIGLDIYDDLDNFHEEEKKKSKELLEWEAKYEESLRTIDELREENKGLTKKIKRIEVNFQSLLDTAKAEIKRKDQQIAALRKEKDDICFRRRQGQHHHQQQQYHQQHHPQFDKPSTSAGISNIFKSEVEKFDVNRDTPGLRRTSSDQPSSKRSRREEPPLQQHSDDRAHSKSRSNRDESSKHREKDSTYAKRGESRSRNADEHHRQAVSTQRDEQRKSRDSASRNEKTSSKRRYDAHEKCRDANVAKKPRHHSSTDDERHSKSNRDDDRQKSRAPSSEKSKEKDSMRNEKNPFSSGDERHKRKSDESKEKDAARTIENHVDSDDDKLKRKSDEDRSGDSDSKKEEPLNVPSATSKTKTRGGAAKYPSRPETIYDRRKKKSLLALAPVKDVTESSNMENHQLKGQSTNRIESQRHEGEKERQTNNLNANASVQPPPIVTAISSTGTQGASIQNGQNGDGLADDVQSQASYSTTELDDGEKLNMPDENCNIPGLYTPKKVEVFKALFGSTPRAVHSDGGDGGGSGDGDGGDGYSGGNFWLTNIVRPLHSTNGLIKNHPAPIGVTAPTIDEKLRNQEEQLVEEQSIAIVPTAVEEHREHLKSDKTMKLGLKTNAIPSSDEASCVVNGDINGVGVLNGDVNGVGDLNRDSNSNNDGVINAADEANRDKNFDVDGDGENNKIPLGEQSEQKPQLSKLTSDDSPDVDDTVGTSPSSVSDCAASKERIQILEDIRLPSVFPIKANDADGAEPTIADADDEADNDKTTTVATNTSEQPDIKEVNLSIESEDEPKGRDTEDAQRSIEENAAHPQPKDNEELPNSTEVVNPTVAQPSESPAAQFGEKTNGEIRESPAIATAEPAKPHLELQTTDKIAKDSDLVNEKSVAAQTAVDVPLATNPDNSIESTTRERIITVIKVKKSRRTSPRHHIKSRKARQLAKDNAVGDQHESQAPENEALPPPPPPPAQNENTMDSPLKASKCLRSSGKRDSLRRMFDSSSEDENPPPTPTATTACDESMNITFDEKFKEIDSRMRSMFASPPYKSSDDVPKAHMASPVEVRHSQNGESGATLDLQQVDVNTTSTPVVTPPTTDVAQPEVVTDMSMNTTTADEPSLNHDDSNRSLNDSVVTKCVSLGSSDYRFEQVSENVVKLFITRKTSRRRVVRRQAPTTAAATTSSPPAPTTITTTSAATLESAT